MKIYTEVNKDGHIEQQAMDRLALACLAFVNGKVTIDVNKFVRKRSYQQQKFYFSGFLQSQLDCLKERTGVTFSKNQIHNWNKTNFFGSEVVDEKTGEIILMPCDSTNDLTTIEFEEKLQVIREKFESAYDWHLPLPSEQIQLSTNQKEFYG